MRIKTRINLLIGAAVSLVACFAVSVFYVASDLTAWMAKSEASREIIKGVFELDALRGDFQFHYSQRAHEQWSGRYASLTALTRRSRELYERPEERRIVELILFNLAKMDDLFRRVDKYRDTEIGRDLRDILLEQSREAVNYASRLAAHSGDRTERLMRRMMFITIAFIFAALLMLALAYFIIRTKVIRPIGYLQKGVKRISEGDLNYKTNLYFGDEIGHFSRAFDHMTSRLAKTQAGLQSELEQRRAAEEKLKFFNEELERKVEERTRDLEQEVDLRQKSEEALKAANEGLEEKVRERTALAETRAVKMRELASELTIAEQKERRRLAHILHDHLQQVLVASKINIGLLRAHLKEEEALKIAGTVDQYVDEAIASSRSLAVELSPPVLNDSNITMAIEWLARWVKDKHRLEVTVEAEENLPVPAEEIKIFLFQAARELLFNVVKHSQSSKALIRLSAGTQAIRISVEDRGRGFDPALLENRDANGFGLIHMRERITILGGRMEVESAPGSGARFSIVMPASPAPEPVPAAAPYAAGSGILPGIRVLIVDDHRIVRQGLVNMLAQHPDIQVAGEAGDGEEAVRKAAELQPNVVVMDITMPKMNGIEAARRIKALMPETRIIGLSLHEAEYMEQEMKEAGGDFYFNKNGNIKNLIDAILSFPASAAGSLQ